ncbi:MAG: glycosyltransferase family 2 protein [Acidobacteriota bacterium]|nr:glycosyltransferase family 2 protein [Acidobacteriota bacterium]
MKISVVIPTYNYAHYLTFALDSVLAQTRAADEIIVVDDGSTDNTREVAARYAPQIHYVYQPNAGLSAARNTGTRLASGDWIAYLDSDDAWKPDKLLRQEEAVRRTPQVSLVFTGFWYLHPDGSFSEGETPTPPERLWPGLRARNLITGSGSSAMVRRTSVLEAEGFNEALRSCEDWDLWVRLKARAEFGVVPERLTIIRVTPQSMSTNAQRMIDSMEAIRETTLLHGLSGITRLLWTGRIRSVAQMHAAITMGAFSRDLERKHIVKSVLYWPNPWFEPRRYLVLVRNLVGHEFYKRVSSMFSRSG